MSATEPAPWRDQLAVRSCPGSPGGRWPSLPELSGITCTFDVRRPRRYRRPDLLAVQEHTASEDPPAPIRRPFGFAALCRRFRVPSRFRPLFVISRRTALVDWSP